MSASSSSARVNLAQVLRLAHPHVDLKLDAYHNQTDAFIKSLRAYADDLKIELKSRREDHVKDTKRGAEKSRELEGQIKVAQEQARQLMELMRTEEAARKGAEAEQADLKRSYAQHKAKLAVFDKDIDHKRAQNATLSTDQSGDRELLERRADDLVPDLLHLQDELKLSIEGINANLLEFKFGITGKGKTCSIVLDHSSRLYKVAQCEPALPNIGDLLDELNESRELYLFLIQVRRSFEEL